MPSFSVAVTAAQTVRSRGAVIEQLRSTGVVIEQLRSASGVIRMSDAIAAFLSIARMERARRRVTDSARLVIKNAVSRRR